MKKKLFISSLSAFLLLENLNANDTKLDEIYVTTATKTEKNIDGVSASVEVITSADIEKSGASTVKDVLKQVPSLNLQYGSFPHPSSASKASISIRGAGSNGTLILLDGKRLAGETDGSYEIDRIPTAIIERIEIVKGSMSTLYGSDAVGGVINIITKKVDSFSSSLDLKYGSNAYSKARNKDLSFTTMGKVDNFRYKIFASSNDGSSSKKNRSYIQKVINPMTNTDLPLHPEYGKSGNFKQTFKDESEVYNFGLGLEQDISEKLTLGLDINYFKEHRDGTYIGSAQSSLGGLVLNTPVDSKDKNRRYDGSISASYYINDDLTTSLRAYKSDYKKRNKTTSVNFAGPVNTKFDANVKIEGIESITSYVVNDANLLTLGLDYRKEKRDSSAINPDPVSSEFMRKNITYKSIYLQDEIEFSDSLNATIGARYDKISDFDSKATVQAGVVQNIFDDSTKLRLNYAQAYRTPDIAELFIMSPYINGMPLRGAELENYNLKPEKSETFEIAISNNYEKLYSELALFRTNTKNKINLKEKNSYRTYENLDKAIVNGAELSLGYAFTNSLDLDLNIIYLKTKDKTINDDLSYTPKLSSTLSLNYQILDNLKTSFIYRYIGKQYEYDSHGNKKSLKAYSLFDTNISYDINKTFTLYGGVDNIFNQKVDESLGYNVGTYYFAGLRTKF